MTEYLRVTPTSEQILKEDIPAIFESLHKLANPANSKLTNRLNPLVDTSPPVFEFTAISEGAEEPVEFYYGVDLSEHLETLAKQLKTIYPDTFDIERVHFTPSQKLIPPAELSRDEFRTRLERQELLYQPQDDDFIQQDEINDSQPTPSTEATDGGQMVPETERSGTDSPSTQYVDVEEGLFELDSPDNISERDPATAIERPTATTRGTVLARPAVEDVEPRGVQWYGQAERKRDWMTTIKPFTEREPNSNEYTTDQPPISVIVDHLTEATHPTGFQVVWQRKPDWSGEAALRKDDLREGRDTFLQRYVGPMFEFGEEPVDSDEYPTPSAVKNRIDRIEAKHPKRTFTVNIRAIGVPNEENSESLDRQLDQFARGLDPLDGPFYRLDSQRVRSRGFRTATKHKRARRLLDRIRNAEIVTGRGKRKPDLVLNGDELANFVSIPSSEEFTVEGTRGTRSEQRSRNPLPRPNPDLMEKFRDGMAIGHALDETGQPEDEPVRLPPSLLTTHYARFGTTGAGKSKASINDILSLYEETDGPTIVVDPKGDGMCRNYMRAHARRFGMTDLEENVLHFPIPEILPGFAFFNIEPTLDNGVDRVDAIQDKADHYESIIKMVMGEERYEKAVVAPNLIKYLIKILYDEEHGLENGVYRESVDYFSHDQLEHVLDQLWEAGPPEPDESAAPQSSKPQVTQKIERQLQLNPHTFATIMGGVSNRFDYISQDDHLRRIFNNTSSQFDFREVLDEQTVILFDLGDLRDEAGEVMTGLIMTMLYDALTERKQDLEQRDDDYVVNLLVDEASSVVVSDIMNTLLEKGRSFRLSVGLSLQFPEQLETEGNRKVYLNVLNDVGSPIIGKIHVDKEIARVMANEDMDPQAFANRISSLPRGEWVTRPPSPTFGETGPEPFSLAPLPIPPGHPESEYPLSEREEAEFQSVLDDIHERTQDSFGVVDSAHSPASGPTVDVDVEADDEQSLDVAMARAIRTVQISEHVRDENGWVPVTAVDTELLDRLNEDEQDLSGIEEFPDIREHSPLIEVDLNEANVVVCRLTTMGEDAAPPDTDSPTGGGDDHDQALFAVEEALTHHGFSVQILDQHGRDRPDGIATHSEIEPKFNIEMETTTHTRPSKILRNLRKAQEGERLPLFVVDGRDGELSGYALAKRVDNVLADPVKRLNSGDTRLYTTTDSITFNGGASATNGVTAARPATDDSRHTRWIRRDDAFVLVDGTDEEHARISDFETASKDQYPATYSYNESAETYTVYRPGELPQTYESKTEFEQQWVPIKHPFVAESQLPVPDYTDDSYVILVLTTQSGSTELRWYDPTAETTREFEALFDALVIGDFYPAGTTASTNADEGNADTEDEFGLQVFTTEHVVAHEAGIAAVSDVYEAYEVFATENGYDVKPKNQFTQALRNHVDIERDKKWLDGKTQRCYVGIELRDTVDEDSLH